MCNLLQDVMTWSVTTPAVNHTSVRPGRLATMSTWRQPTGRGCGRTLRVRPSTTTTTLWVPYLWCTSTIPEKPFLLVCLSLLVCVYICLHVYVIGHINFVVVIMYMRLIRHFVLSRIRAKISPCSHCSTYSVFLVSSYQRKTWQE